MFDAAKITDDLIGWIRGYFEENGDDCPAVVGISGGKDSSTTAALCVKALGAQRVYAVLMPQGEQRDIGYSKEIVSLLGIKSFTVNIKHSVDALLSSIKESGVSLNRQAIINIPARVRMTTLYAVSAAVNGRVANTCNLSEDWVGYATKFGDTAGDFSPLSWLTVAEVKEIGRLLLPAKFIEKVPEDGLSGLTDEENLGFSYETLDKYIRFGEYDDEAAVDEIDRLHKLNLHKLARMPVFKPDY